MKKIIYVMAALLLTACNPFGRTPGNPNPAGSPVGDEIAAPPQPGAPSETATANVAPPDSGSPIFGSSSLNQAPTIKFYRTQTVDGVVQNVELNNLETFTAATFTPESLYCLHVSNYTPEDIANFKIVVEDPDQDPLDRELRVVSITVAPETDSNLLIPNAILTPINGECTDAYRCAYTISFPATEEIIRTLQWDGTYKVDLKISDKPNDSRGIQPKEGTNSFIIKLCEVV